MDWEPGTGVGTVALVVGVGVVVGGGVGSGGGNGGGGDLRRTTGLTAPGVTDRTACESASPIRSSMSPARSCMFVFCVVMSQWRISARVCQVYAYAHIIYCCI